MKSNRKFQILFDSVKNKCDFLSNANNTLDGKAASLMGFELALGIGYFMIVFQNLTGIKFYEGLIGLICLTISIFLLLYINWPKDYLSISVNITKHKDYLKKSEKRLLLQLISDAQNAFTKNNLKIKCKVKYYRIAVILLFVASILFILSKLGKIYV